MKTLLFATHNEHKVEEIRAILNHQFKIISLKDASIDQEIPEPFATLEENAKEKARVIHQLTQKDCFSEDTGLEVDALNGEPGVKSARYAGEERSFEKNIDLLLANLKDVKSRKARFRTVVCLRINGEEKLFDGICKGTIIAEPRGTSGFGYDPVFIPDGSDRTFAEMSLAEKNRFSHRKKAIEKFTSYLINR
jgi:XTP/dITP diphosphohydrolase